MEFMKNGPLGGRSHLSSSPGPSRSLFNRRKYRNVDDETYNKAMQRGGNIGGLVNDGNTCFMNSVIQSLSSSNTLLDFLEHEMVESEAQHKDLKFTKSLKTLLQNLNARHYEQTHDYKTTAMLKTMSKSPNKNFLLGYNQEDAQEFFQTLLSELESDFKKIRNLDQIGSTTPTNVKNEAVYKDSLPQDAKFGSDKLGELGDVYIPAYQIDPNLQDAQERVFKFNLLTPVDGLSAERIGCLHCGEMGGIRYSVISGLSLNLPSDNYAALRLTELLSEWIKPEIIEGVECNRCALNHVLEYQKDQLLKLEENQSSNYLQTKLQERIHEIETELQKPIIDDDVFKKLHTKNMIQKSSKSKQILISRPPPLLAIHINRSVFDPMTYRVRKNNARVVFPLKLNLDPYVAEPNDINTDARMPLSKKMKSFENEGEDEKESSDLIEDVVVNGVTEEDEEVVEQEQPEDIGFDKEPEDNNNNNDDIELKLNPKAPEEEDVSDSDDEEEGEEISKTNSIASVIEKQDISGPLVYQLRSVIIHYGTHNYGHYVAYRKFRGVWWRTSDETIDIVDEDEVLSADGVFMLFYELDSLTQELAKDEEEFALFDKVEINEDGLGESDEINEDKEDKEDEDNEDKDKEDEVQQQQALQMANL